MSIAQLNHGYDSLSQKSNAGIAKYMVELRNNSGLLYRAQLDTSWKEKGRQPLLLPENAGNWNDLRIRRRLYESAASNAQIMESTLAGQGMLFLI